MSFPNTQADIEGLDTRFHLHSQTDPLRHEHEGPLMIVGGEGPYVFDLEGNRYFDSVASLWCASLGFSDRRLAQAGATALETLPVYHTFNRRSNPYVAELSSAIAAIAPMPDARVFFTDGGSESVDTMVKMAWYYWSAMGAPQRRKIMARQGGFHGSTVMAARVSGLPNMHASFNLPDCNVVHAARPHYYRDAHEGESEIEFAQRLARELEEQILEEGPETIAAFIAEPVMGAGGVIVPPEGYLQAVADIVRKYGILFLSDEIICGFGRTGNWFGCQTFGVVPDIMSIAKGLSSGYAPIGGVVVSNPVYSVIANEANRNGVFSHGFTYSGHPVSAAIALEALKIYRDMELPALAARLGGRLAEGLRSLSNHAIVGNVRQCGFLAGVELVEDKLTRRPFPAALNVGARVEARTRHYGLIVRNLGDTIALCPPYVTSEDEVGQMLDKLSRAIDDVAAEILPLSSAASRDTDS